MARVFRIGQKKFDSLGFETIPFAVAMNKFLQGGFCYAYLPLHQKIAAVPLILIGLSYISLQITVVRAWDELTKGLLLGCAFLLWGTEQLMPVSELTTMTDEGVITIFVVDLGLVILSHLKLKVHKIP